MWIKIIFAKVDTTSSIKEIKAATEIEVERLLWVLRTDNNGEFTIKEFIAYCTNEGIQRHFSTPYTRNKIELWSARSRQCLLRRAHCSRRGKCRYGTRVRQ
jgi:hypothetical protein